jgi:predicted thioesterase
MTQHNPARIEPGLEGFCQRIVPREWTLAHIDPSLPAVFSTPAMIGIMEMACTRAVRNRLPAGAITVGVRIEVDHLKSVPAGATVVAVSKLVKVDGRKLIFEVEVRSGTDIIGRGHVFHTIVRHSRLIGITAEKPASR